MKVLLDTCIVIDILQQREPFFEDSMKVLNAVSDGSCIGCLTAKSIADIYYIIKRSIHNEEQVRKYLQILFTLFEVRDTFSTDCYNALSSQMNDYEDAIMTETAIRINADCIVTRNIKDYTFSKVPAYLPEDFLKILGKF